MNHNATAYNHRLWATARNERLWMHRRREAAIALSIRLNAGSGKVPWKTDDPSKDSECPVHIANRNLLNNLCDGATV